MLERAPPGAVGASGALTRVEPGRRLGNYQILRCIGHGGMASVWVAQQHGARGFTKLVALKTILPELAVDPGFERMLLEEARLAALIRHPNVCEIFELIELEGLLAVSMEWVDGVSLSGMLAGSKQRLDPRIAARIVAQAGAGLHAAHELRDEGGRALGLVHRDVSPQNILISRDGHVRLSDFGIAKAMDNRREATAAGQVKGKLAYMSPEQARDDELDRRSDVFSLGIVLYCSVLGKRPFSRPGERRDQALARLLDVDYPRPREVDPTCPAELASIIERAMQQDPALRYQSADELRQALEQWLLTSGALTTEHAVARALNERCGSALDERASSIRAALDAQLGVPRSEPERVSRERGVSAMPADTTVAHGAVKTGKGPQKRAVLRLRPAAFLGVASLLAIAASVRLTGLDTVQQAPRTVAVVTPNVPPVVPVLTTLPPPEAMTEPSAPLAERRRAVVSNVAAGASSSGSAKKSFSGAATAVGGSTAIGGSTASSAVASAESAYRGQPAPSAAPPFPKPIGPTEREL
jgi:eukaryotic-like serine/threonine-protein kinase